MSNYIIPDGWNPMTERWEDGHRVNVITNDGVIRDTSSSTSYVLKLFKQGYPVAWQYPVPLEIEKQYVARAGHKLTNIARRDAASIPLVMVSQSLDNHEVITNLIIKLLESIHDNN